MCLVSLPLFILGVSVSCFEYRSLRLVRVACANKYWLQDTYGLPAVTYEIQSILRARTIRRGRGKFRQALVKWTGWIEPSWEPVEYIQDTKALDEFEKKYGPIEDFDGPTKNDAGTYVGQAKQHTIIRRRSQRIKNKTS